MKKKIVLIIQIFLSFILLFFPVFWIHTISPYFSPSITNIGWFFSITNFELRFQQPIAIISGLLIFIGALFCLFALIEELRLAIDKSPSILGIIGGILILIAPILFIIIWIGQDMATFLTAWSGIDYSTSVFVGIPAFYGTADLGFGQAYWGFSPGLYINIFFGIGIIIGGILLFFDKSKEKSSGNGKNTYPKKYQQIINRLRREEQVRRKEAMNQNIKTMQSKYRSESGKEGSCLKCGREVNGSDKYCIACKKYFLEEQ
ncbi:MAG: hypothetical protein EAX96_19725 [Candidatus Lokiarchaeota archaeon]|nr:hypothetical protein [Candidatus Lokiarchaeota archaeon]